MSRDWLWLIVSCVVLLLFLGAVLVPIRLRLRLQGKGDPSGAWALAGAAQLGPLIASGVGARGLTPTLRVHVFSRTLYQRTLPELLTKKEPETDEPEETLGEKLERTIDRMARADRRLPAENLLGFLIRERRRLELEILEVDLDYSFADVATTGKLLGAIYAVSALFPPQIVIRQHPAWVFEDRAEIAASGSIRVWPGLLVVDALVFLVRNGKTILFPRRAPEAT